MCLQIAVLKGSSSTLPMTPAAGALQNALNAMRLEPAATVPMDSTLNPLLALLATHPARLAVEPLPTTANLAASPVPWLQASASDVKNLVRLALQAIPQCA